MKIYNTLTRKKEEFVPIEEGKVKYTFTKNTAPADRPYTTISTSETQDLSLFLTRSENIWNTAVTR